MKKPAFNPYLPFWETVPDGEPKVFGDRLYIYGSHDKLKGVGFCEDDYVCWSAPVDDLGNWQCHGVSYKKTQDPINGAPYEGTIPEYNPFGAGDMHLMFAPDVAQGRDGRYYMYYGLDFVGVISVAVSERPEGPFEFYGYVTKEDGSLPYVGNWYDPGVICEESGTYLYVGFCPPFKFPGMEDKTFEGAMMVKLADDMHTIISEPVCVANGPDTAAGTSFEAHPFFEASSIRHYGEWYYFVYASTLNHELCYAMGRTPEGPFEYKGVLLSNADIGFGGNTLATNYYGNNHGGLVKIGDKTYIFGHRHTHASQFSRQGIAEEVTILGDGTIHQAELTSCGLNGGPLPAKGSYRTYIACHLTEADRSKVGECPLSRPFDFAASIPEEVPYITEEECGGGEKGLMPYIYNMRCGATAGFKYFAFDGNETEISVLIRGRGKLGLALDSSASGAEAVAVFESTEDGWNKVTAKIVKNTGTHALFFTTLEGKLDFAEFEVM